MKLSFAARGWLALVIILLFGKAQNSQTIAPAHDRKVASRLLAKAADATNLKDPGGPSFHMRAKTKLLGSNNELLEGIYELWWSSPDEWREETTWNGRTVVTIAANGQLWTRGTNRLRLESTRLSRVLDFSSRLMPRNGGWISRTESKELEGISALCLYIPWPTPIFSGSHASDVMVPPIGGSNERFICLDATERLPMRMGSGSMRLDFSGYSEIGNKRFPRLIRQVEGKKQLMEIVLDTLEPFEPAANQIFDHAMEFESKPWCAEATTPVPLKLAGKSGVPAATGNGVGERPWFMLPRKVSRLGFLILRIGDNGQVTDVHAFRSGGEEPLSESDKKVLRDSLFQPATCKGRPIEAEYPMHFPELPFGG